MKKLLFLSFMLINIITSHAISPECAALQEKYQAQFSKKEVKQAIKLLKYGKQHARLEMLLAAETSLIRRINLSSQMSDLRGKVRNYQHIGSRLIRITEDFATMNKVELDEAVTAECIALFSSCEQCLKNWYAKKVLAEDTNQA